MHKSREPSQEYLRERFDYDAERGVLVWKAHASRTAQWHACNEGEPVGHIDPYGYKVLKLDGQGYKYHRIVWVLCNGAVPDGLVVDHVNGDRADNRIENLRVVTRSLNSAIGKRSSRAGIPKGAWKHPTTGRWVSYLCTNGVKKYLGSYKTAEEAAEVYALAFFLVHGVEPA